MSGKLILTDDGWELETDGGNVVDSGDYPLEETNAFRINAADKLDSDDSQRPYERVDNRSKSDNF